MNTFTLTDSTTNVTRIAFGTRYQTTARLYRVEGKFAKPEGQRPFLTSLAQCREYVRDCRMHYGE